MSALGKFAGSAAGGYAILGIVVIVGFVVIHKQLKQDVKDARTPLGQGFDDTIQRGINWLFGNDPNTGFVDQNGNSAPPTTYPVPYDFGLAGDTTVWD